MGRIFGIVGAAISALLAGASGRQTVVVRGVPRTIEHSAAVLPKPRSMGKTLSHAAAAARLADRQDRAARSALYADKTRGPGERAHRRWRKRRAAGRAA